MPLDLVLDTNVVLDWLVFRDPVALPLQEAIAAGRHRWIGHAGLRAELAHVVRRDALRRWVADADAVLAAHDARVVDVGLPPPLGAGELLRCTDPDDQPFIDLAVARRAHALLTRDRAVLKLAPRAERLGVRIHTPEAWLGLPPARPAQARSNTARLSTCAVWGNMSTTPAAVQR